MPAADSWRCRAPSRPTVTSKKTKPKRKRTMLRRKKRRRRREERDHAPSVADGICSAVAPRVLRVADRLYRRRRGSARMGCSRKIAARRPDSAAAGLEDIRDVLVRRPDVALSVFA